MAKGGGRRGGLFGGGPTTGPDRIDENSSRYENRYDPRRELNYTAAHLESADQLREAVIEQDLREKRQRARENAPAAQAMVVDSPLINYVPPPDSSWAASVETINSNNLQFNPAQHPFFDSVVAGRSGIRALYDANDKDFARYEGLRTNLAVLRNFIIGTAPATAGEQISLERLENIAAAIGDTLANDTWYKRPFTRSLDIDVANIEGVGAAEIYKQLLSVQLEPGLLKNLIGNVRTLGGFTDIDWGLAPIELTPFSPEALAAPSQGSRPAQAVQDKTAAAHTPEAGDADRMLAFSENALRSAKQLRAVTDMSQDKKEESVEEARKILRWLRNLQFADKDVEEWLDQGTPAEQLAKTEALSQLISLYENRLTDAIQRNPVLADELAVKDANDAAGGAARALASHTTALYHADSRAADLQALSAALPESSRVYEEQSVARLLDTMETGLERVSGKNVSDLSPVERLVEMSNRIQAAAHRLRSIDTLEPPAREESIELAREILRKLRNLSFSDKPVEELIDSGRPEDKAILAQKLEEVVDSYQNLLREAAQLRPEILQDPLVKEANEAVGGFAYAVKLMAAKEMPNSIAAAQQISADVAHTPEAWKDLHHRTVDRLVTSMEGGLEKAVGVVEEQQQQDDELDQDLNEANLNTTHESTHKKKKKRKRYHKSGKGGKKQEKIIRDMTADDYVLKQGRFAHDARVGLNDTNINLTRSDPKAATAEVKAQKEAAFMHGLKPEDMEAIRKLGGSLRDIGQQLKNISATVTTVSATDKIAPDDKTISQRVIETELQKAQRLGQITGPGV